MNLEDLLSLPRNAPVHFPLPDGAFPQLKLTLPQVRRYRSMEQHIIDETLRLELTLRPHLVQPVEKSDWKVVAARQHLRVYKRSTRVSFFPPSVLCVGSVLGTVEDALCGLYDESSEDARAVGSLTSKSHMDAAVLATMERSSAQKPFRLLSLQWQLQDSGLLMKPRDYVTIKAMGIRIDTHDRRFGYALVKSVKRQEVPPFSDRLAVRGNMMICCIFRQLSPSTVGVFAKAVVDLGDVPDWLGYKVACSVVPAMLDPTRCLAAKRLAELSLRHSRVLRPSKLHTSVFRSTLRATATKLKLRSGAAGPVSLSGCSVCDGERRVTLRVSVQCQVCGEDACAKCRVKQTVMATPANVRVWCCKRCLLAASALPINPIALCPVMRGFV